MMLCSIGMSVANSHCPGDHLTPPCLDAYNTTFQSSLELIGWFFAGEPKREPIVPCSARSGHGSKSGGVSVPLQHRVRHPRALQERTPVASSSPGLRGDFLNSLQPGPPLLLLCSTRCAASTHYNTDNTRRAANMVTAVRNLATLVLAFVLVQCFAAQCTPPPCFDFLLRLRFFVTD